MCIDVCIYLCYMDRVSALQCESVYMCRYVCVCVWVPCVGSAQYKGVCV